MGFGWGLKEKWAVLLNELRIRWDNSVGRPLLFRFGTPERLGVAFLNPSDMCVPDRIMLYALVRGLRPQAVLEIGVRWGGGARILAAALEDAGGPGKAFGIDPAPEAFRIKSRELFGRYELVRGYSPEAIPDVITKLGRKLDFVLIDAMHTYNHVLADLEGVLPHVAAGGHILLHDAFHVGINQAVIEVLKKHHDCMDCGFLCRHPWIGDAPVAYQGLRLLRVGACTGEKMIEEAYRTAGHSTPNLSDEFWNWDFYWNKIESSGDKTQ